MAAKSAAARKAQRQAEGGASYVVFARRFRPQTFGDVVGQETITASLKLALRTGRLAQAYLFTGPRGVGKTSLARIFAKALNCMKGSGPGGVAEEPCNECSACAAIQDGSSLDVIEMDAATHRSIDDIRDLRMNVTLAPSLLRFKVYIVDEVHMLTMEAWNAFLKTLEEPPAHVKFIFATTDPEKIPETILSRCQRHDLRRIGVGDTIKRLRRICEAEGLEAEPAALERIASLSRGGLRDAESLLDQAVNLGEGRITDQIVRQLSGAAPDELILEVLLACVRGELPVALARASAALNAGADPADLLAAFCERLRGTLLVKTCGADSALLEGQTHLKDSYQALGQLLSEDQLLMLLQLFSGAQRQVKDAAQARLPVEMVLVRAARVSELVDLGKLVRALESGAGAPGVERPAPREAPRPNFAGRPAGPDPRPAAEPPAAGALSPVGARAPSQAAVREPPAPAEAGGGVTQQGRPERWSQLLEALRRLPGGNFTATALSHAVDARLDLSAGRLDLGFTQAQGFYVESLERPERAAVLRQALEGVYGRPVQVQVARVERAARPVLPATPEFRRPAAPAAPAARPPPRAAPAPAPEEMDTAVEFDDEGALPLPEVAHAEAGASMTAEADEDYPEAAPLVLPRPTAPPRQARVPAAGSVDPRVSANPFVKTLAARVDGEVLHAERLAREEDAAPQGRRDEPSADR